MFRFAIPFLVLSSLLVSPMIDADSLETVQVVRSNSTRTVALDGRIEAERQAELAAQTGGRIIERLVEAGDSVKKGQVLLRIDDREMRQMNAVSSAQLKAAEAELKQAQLDRERSAAMLSKKLIGQAVFDQAETRFRAAQANVNALKASVALAETQASFTKVVAPFSGLVSEVNVKVGDLALPGKPLLIVYAPERFRVIAPASLSLLSLWQREAPVQVIFADATQTIAAQTVLMPQTDPYAQQVSIRFDLPTSITPQLPGSFAKVAFPITGEKELIVPAKSVVRRGELTAVYVVSESSALQLRQVRLGKTLGDHVEVLAGLSEGEHIARDTAAATTIRAEQNKGAPHAN